MPMAVADAIGLSWGFIAVPAGLADPMAALPSADFSNGRAR